MPRGRVCEPLVMTAEEQQKLEGWVRRPKTAQRLALRARIVLKCATGMPNQDVARELRLDVHTVGKWRERFRISRLEGLTDEPRPGAPRQISDEQVEEVITRTLERPPAQGTHWSTRTMAKQSGLSQTAVSRIWRAFALPRVSWRRRATSEGCISTLRIAPSCSASTRRARCRPWIAPSPCCRCAL